MGHKSSDGPSEICVWVSITYLESCQKCLRGKHALKHQAQYSSLTHACCKTKSSQCAFFMHTSQSFCYEKLNPCPPIGTLKTSNSQNKHLCPCHGLGN